MSTEVKNKIKNHKIRLYKMADFDDAGFVPQVEVNGKKVDAAINNKMSYGNVLDMLTEKARKYKNAAQGISADQLAELQALTVIAVEFAEAEMDDHSGALFNAVSLPNATQTVVLQEILPYIGDEGTVSGTNDHVPLLDATIPTKDMVKLFVRGFGWKDSLLNDALNPFYSPERVTRSAATLSVDAKNRDFFKPVIEATYDANHSQSPDTVGTTYHLKIRNTLEMALQKAYALKHPVTGKRVSAMAHKNYLLCNPVDALIMRPIVAGQIGIQTTPQFMGALDLDVIAYDGGNFDGLTYGKKTLEFPGIPQGTAYIYVKNIYGAQKVIKRNTSLAVGAGDVLELSTERKAWHRIDGVFLDWVLPTAGAGKGAIIKITLPTR